jgi:hypothetical protein
MSNQADKIEITVEGTEERHGQMVVLTRLRLKDSSLSGRSATLCVEKRVEVKDSRPVNTSERLHTQNIVVTEGGQFEIPHEVFKTYTYRGSMIDIDLRFIIEVDTGILFDTTVTDEMEKSLHNKPESCESAGPLVDPDDEYNFSANLKALPRANRVRARLFMLAGLIAVGVNLLLGVYDLVAPEGITLFHNHLRGLGGDYPFFVMLVVTGVVAVVFWILTQSQLKKYMVHFKLKALPELLDPQTELRVSDLVTGIPFIPLKNVELRVVACNLECGAYRRGTGSDVRTVRFQEPVRPLLLYSKRFDHLPSGVPIENQLDETFPLRPMFSALYPPNIILNHGLRVHWEVQLLHPEFIDQELVVDTTPLRYEDFLEA